MRPSSLIYILVGVVIFASYQILNQPRFPNLPPDQSDVSGQSKSDPPSTYKDESRSQDDDVVPANLNADESTAKDDAQLDGKLTATNQSSETAKDEAQPDGNLLATNQSSDPRAAKKNLSYLADYAYSEVPPETKPAQGAAEHVSHPDRLAWKSMCTTDEGRVKGEKWCKRAIWGNTLPAIKHIWKTVNNFTSGAFVGMWQQRVSQFYSRYSETTAK